MREILFRGKRTYNGEWVEGSLLVWPDGSTEICHTNPNDNEELLKVIVRPDTIGQFTGLTDKNGKKIFEGDVVDASAEWWYACGPAGHDSPTLEVKWDEEVCGFAPFAIYDCDCGVYISASGCEVIGNIHDNPELLGGADNERKAD